MSAQVKHQDVPAGDAADMQAPDQGAASRAQKKAPSAFRTISEVADELDVQQHVLRFWETKFTQVKPLKRGGGRRYYRPEDVALLRRIHHLLYTEGYTIKGVQKLMKGQGKQQIAASAPATVSRPANEEQAPASRAAESPRMPAAPALQGKPLPSMTDKQRMILEAMLGELKELRGMIRGE